MNITGNKKNNTLNGTDGDDVISGLGGKDTLNGKKGNDQLFGGNGNDVLRGGTGDNFFNGGEGNDTYYLTGRYENVEVGLGDDRIDLSSFSKGDGYLGVHFHAAAKGVFAIIDGEEDFGVIRIENGSEPEGLVEFKNLNNALQLDYSKPEGGMGIDGTAYDDVFMIDPGEQGWIQIKPGEGEDVIQIMGTTGTVRLDYSDMSDGIFANLKFGLIVDGGNGFSVDRIIGEGRAKELRGTDFDDVIYGSREDDRFILRQGDDFVAGGAGVDTIRYDRSGVDAVQVDLSKGTATGVWNGQAFTHKLKNIENIRGSRADNDTLSGNFKDNQIDGKGGNDTIQGKGGNDVLIGGDGNDKFIFKNNDGNDYIVDFNTSGSKEKISLKGVAEITSFNDLMSSHISDIGGWAYIDDGAGLTITLQGVSTADLSNNDFVF